MRFTLFILGIALLLTGLWLVYKPLTLIVSGLLLTYIAVRSGGTATLPTRADADARSRFEA